jgi:hypothetical protein
MSNQHWLSRPSLLQDGVIEYVANASLGIEVGDLMYQAVDDARPASSQADALSETANQALFARNFIGISTGQRLAADATAGVIRVQVAGLKELTCTSATFEIGDYVGADEAASGTALEDQSVKKVTNPDHAIGRVVARYASATTKVWVELITMHTKAIAQQGDALAGWTAQTIAMGDAAVTLTRVPGTPTGVFLYGNWLLVDAESGTTENLLLPHEADCAGVLLLIKNTGGETINLQNDAGGAVATIATSETCFAHCDGTTWTVMQHVFTT